jgi:hypothetical protein
MRWLFLIAALLAWPLTAQAQFSSAFTTGRSSFGARGGFVSPAPAVASYTGPLDVYTASPVFCFSLRACAAADATGTTSAIDIKCNGTTFTGIKILSTGNLDVATTQSDCPTNYAKFTGTTVGTALTVSSVTGTIATGQLIIGPGITTAITISSGSGFSWVLSGAVTTNETSQPFGTSSIAVTTWYDQFGGNNVVQNLSGTHNLEFGGCGNSVPVCIANDAGWQFLGTLGTFSSPKYWAAVYNSFGALSNLFDVTSGGDNRGFIVDSPSANNIAMVDGNRISAAANDNVWHIVHGYVNNTDSKLIVDGGTPVTGDTSTNGVTSGLTIFNGGNENEFLGNGTEIIMWNSEPTTTQMNNVCHNEFLYWGTSVSC